MLKLMGRFKILLIYRMHVVATKTSATNLEASEAGIRCSCASATVFYGKKRKKKKLEKNTRNSKAFLIRR